MNQHAAADVLLALSTFHLSATAPTFMKLVRLTGLGAAEVSQAIDELSAANLVNGERLRLTLLGFATARALSTPRARATRAA